MPSSDCATDHGLARPEKEVPGRIRCSRRRRLPGSAARGDAERMSDSPERYFVRMEGDRPVRLPVAAMTPEERVAGVAFQERELQLMQETARRR